MLLNGTNFDSGRENGGVSSRKGFTYDEILIQTGPRRRIMWERKKEKAIQVDRAAHIQ